MRFFLVIPPYVVDERDLGVRPNKAMLPVGPLSIASALLERGHTVDVIDLVFEPEWRDPLQAKLISTTYDQFLLSCHTARNIAVCKKVVQVLRAFQPEVLITIGGNVCTELGIEDFKALGLDVDAVVRGYGHGRDMIDALVEGQPGDLKARFVDSTLPVPAFHLFDTETRKNYLESTGKYPLVGPGGFGCHWRCAYCSAKMDSRSIARNEENILAELNQAVAYGYTHIWCVDNLVTVDPQKVLRFDKAVAERGLTWSGMTRAELVVKTPDIFLHFTSLQEIAFGIESVTDEELKKYNRGSKSDYLEMCRKALQIVSDAGIATNAFVMLGGPDGNEEGFWQLYRFLKTLPLSTISWSFFNPSPKALLNKDGLKSEQFGFYRWPFGQSTIPPQRVVQEAMILSGVFWDKFVLDQNRPFFEDNDVFGANFLEAQLFQEKTARSSIGDGWEVWRKEEAS